MSTRDLDLNFLIWVRWKILNILFQLWLSVSSNFIKGDARIFSVIPDFKSFHQQTKKRKTENRGKVSFSFWQYFLYILIVVAVFLHKQFKTWIVQIDMYKLAKWRAFGCLEFFKYSVWTDSFSVLFFLEYTRNCLSLNADSIDSARLCCYSIIWWLLVAYFLGWQKIIDQYLTVNKWGWVSYEELWRSAEVDNTLRDSFKIIPSLIHWCIDVQFIFDSVRLGLSSSTNILQIADVKLWVVFLLFLLYF